MGKKKRKFKQSLVHEPWLPFGPSRYPPEHEAMLRDAHGPKKWIGTFRNNLYQVEMAELETLFGPGTIWLSIVRTDRTATHDWRHLQRIKNELCGPEREAIEIYPAESRVVDTNNQYHLFVLPQGCTLPIGYVERDVSDWVGDTAHKQRPFAEPPEGLNARPRDDVSQRIFAKPPEAKGDGDDDGAVEDS